MRSQSAGMGRHAVVMVGSTILVAVLNYALNIILGWTLPVDDYGRVGVSQTLIFIGVWFVSAGFPWVVTRAVAQAGSEGASDEHGAEAWRTYKSAWLASSLLTVAMVALLLVAFYLGWLHLEPVYGPLILLVAITAGSLGIGAVPNAALQGLFRFDAISALRVFEAVVNVVVSVALVIIGLGAGGALAGFAFSAVLASIVPVWLLRDTPVGRTRGWGKLDALWIALPMTLAVFGGVLLTNIDLLSIKFLTGPANSDALSGAYQVAAVLARAPLFVGTALVSTFYPRISQEAISQGNEGASVAGRQLMRWVVLGVLPMNVIMAFGAPAVVLFFFPAQYASSGVILSVLAAGSGFLVVASALAAVLQAMHRVAVPAVVMSGAVFLQVIGLWLFVPSFGVMGAAIVSALTSLLACAVLLLSCRRMHLSPAKMAWHGVALAGLALLSAAMGFFFPGAGRLPIAIWVSGAVALYVVAILLFGLVEADEFRSAGSNPKSGPVGAVVGRALRVASILNDAGNRIAGGPGAGRI